MYKMFSDVDKGMTEEEFNKKYPRRKGEYAKIKKEIADMNESVEEGACTYANPLMAGKTYTCCDCGDEMHVPTTTCQHDSHDETGSWWRDENGNGVPDLFESYKANVATLLKG